MFWWTASRFKARFGEDVPTLSASLPLCVDSRRGSGGGMGGASLPGLPETRPPSEPTPLLLPLSTRLGGGSGGAGIRFVGEMELESGETGVGGCFAWNAGCLRRMILRPPARFRMSRCPACRANGGDVLLGPGPGPEPGPVLLGDDAGAL